MIDHLSFLVKASLVERYEKAKARFDEVTEAIAQRSAKGERLAGFIRTLEAQDEPAGAKAAHPVPAPAPAHPCASVAEFDERLWCAMVDYVTVDVGERLTVVFRDGTGISTMLCSL